MKDQIEKQAIEEMARTICEADILCDTCGESTDSYCAEAIAALLINAGYSKHLEGEWIAKATMTRTPSAINYTCSVCGCESARTTPYCPNCGAKMKGGAE